jgi:GT2 family glycosyltransferase
LKVSIITVCHNQLQHTKRFIASLKRFTPQEPIAWELIGIDSGSTDGTDEYLRQHCVSICLDENQGWIKGINTGINHVKQYIPDTDIIIFANNDIVLDSPGWLERLCKHFDNPTVGAVGPTSNYVIGRQNVACNVPHVTEEDTKTVVGFFFAVRKGIVDQIGPLEENFAKYVPEYPEEARQKLALGGADDLDYSRRIREAGWKLVIARDVFVYHAGSKTFMEVVGKDGYDAQWKLADLAFERKWGPGSRAECFPAVVTRHAIGLPMRGNHPNWLFSKALVHLQKPDGWNMIESRRSMVDQARNQIADLAMKHGIEYLLFLDDDHTFPPDLWYRLIAHQKDVVGALCFRRIEPFGPCIFRWETSKDNGNLMVWDRSELIGKGLQKVDAIGFGAVLIKTSVFAKLGPAPWFKFSEVGEDLHFCDLCAKNGVDVWCDTSLVAPHINDDGFEVTEKTYIEHAQWKAKGVTA